MTKEEIILSAENVFSEFSGTCNKFDDAAFFLKPGPKWSVAENLQHLILSIKMTNLAYRLPLFLVRWIGGKQDREALNFDGLLAAYHTKLSTGATASRRFIPKPIKINYGKEKLLDNWKKVTEQFIAAVKSNRSEKDLDDYYAKHPLLGRISLRELCYFTIFHTDHHTQSLIKNSGIPQ
jgi:DinB superfamily